VDLADSVPLCPLALAQGQTASFAAREQHCPYDCCGQHGAKMTSNDWQTPGVGLMDM